MWMLLVIGRVIDFLTGPGHFLVKSIWFGAQCYKSIIFNFLSFNLQVSLDIDRSDVKTAYLSILISIIAF